MKKYTLVIKTRQAGVLPEQVKAAVEETLLRATPPKTYRFGTAAQAEPGTILVSVGSDGKREFLLQALSRLERRLPARVERIEWGNQVPGAEAGADASPNAIDEGPRSLRKDPYRETAPQNAPSRTYRPSIWSNLRGMASYVFIITWILIAFFTILLPGSQKTSILDNPAASIALQIWIFLSIMVGPPYIPWRVIRSIDCDPQGIEVRYWLWSASVRRGWAEISGLKVTFLDLTVYSGQPPVRFSAKQNTGFPEEPTLVKTIIQRADLCHVESNLTGVVYKRADAPD